MRLRRGESVTGKSSEGFALSYSQEGKRVVREFRQPRVLIGRSMLCDVVLDSPDLSRKHAEIRGDEWGWKIHDLSSQGGTYVRQQRVAVHRLHDGDQIVLSPSAARPVVLTFHRLAAAEPPRRKVVLDDAPERTQVVASIDLKDFEQSLVSPTPPRIPTPPLRRELRPPKPTPNVAERVPPAALLNVFKRVGDVLLVCEDLAKMLEEVLTLVLDNLPGARGLICLYDAATGQIEPKAFRTSRVQEDEPFTVSRTILNEAIHIQRAMLVANAMDDPRFQGAVSVRELQIRSAMCVPLYHAGQVKGVVYVDSEHGGQTFTGQDLELLAVLGLMVAVGITQMMLRDDLAKERAVRSKLSRYNSPRVVEQIMSRTADFDGEMLAEDHEVSVLFVDIVHFTSMAENMRPAEVIQVLNTVFERLADAVFQHDGTLDKYIGDAAMVVFGAPLAQPDHALRAVRTAMLMRDVIEQCNQAAPEGRRLQVRIGINSGNAVVGDIGSPLRKEYTAIGDVVNTASRLESSVARPGDIVIGPLTYEQVKDAFACEPLAEVQLRGRQQMIQPYRVVGARDDARTS
jgi:adenylate cyclase